ncbi:hypothetical protein LCGC14_2057710, partial [marine sediment metagenome]
NGTGLGLGIARRLVDRMGGTLVCTSAVGQGSTFSFELETSVAANTPLPEERPEKPSVRKDMSSRVMQILIVEDNDINRELLEKMLATAGHEVTAASNATTGIAAADHRAFDLILMDISMPDINGMKATEAIRTSGGPSHRTPVYAVTAHALPEERARFRAAGMDGCLIKPVRRSNLLEVLESVPATTDLVVVRPDHVLLDLEQFRNLESVLTADRMVTMLSIFAEEVVSLMARLDGSVTASNLRSLQKNVHQISGSAAIFGAVHLHKSLGRIETACKNDDPATVNRLALNLEEVWPATFALISETVDLPPPKSLTMK